MYQMSQYSPLERITYQAPVRSDIHLEYAANTTSGLEYTAQNAISTSIYAPSLPPMPNPSFTSLPTPSFSPKPLYRSSIQYAQEIYQTSYFPSLAKEELHFSPETFIAPGFVGQFVGSAGEIEHYIKEAFELTTGKSLPSNINISVLNEQEFRKIAPSQGTIGLSINRNHCGLVSEIFVLNSDIARVMLTLGHEIGHVFSPTLGNAQDEEAKAYAFSFMWMQKIQEHNIAGLQDAVVLENPAKNGLDDVALQFVANLAYQHSYSEIHAGLVDRNISIAS